MELERIFGDSSEPRYGVVGWPLRHSLSPAMHAAALAAYRISADYRAIPVPPEEWSSFLSHASGPRGLQGFNVTIPFKERLGDFLSDLSTAANACGAVNTVWRDPSGWTGDNTDAPGFLEDLDRRNFPWRGATVLLLGAGGAARAALFALRSGPHPAREIVVFNRTPARAHGLITDCRSSTGPLPHLSEDLAREVLRSDLLVNATAVGLAPNDPSPVPAACLHRDLAVYDMIYHRDTALLAAARAAGARAEGGLGMLVNQGALAFERWFGPALKNKLDYSSEMLRDLMRQAAQAALRERTSS